eukprot:7391850-Prymnesium_polylepis.1
MEVTVLRKEQHRRRSAARLDGVLHGRVGQQLTARQGAGDGECVAGLGVCAACAVCTSVAHTAIGRLHAEEQHDQHLAQQFLPLGVRLLAVRVPRGEALDPTSLKLRPINPVGILCEGAAVGEREGIAPTRHVWPPYLARKERVLLGELLRLSAHSQQLLGAGNVERERRLARRECCRAGGQLQRRTAYVVGDAAVLQRAILAQHLDPRLGPLAELFVPRGRLEPEGHIRLRRVEPTEEASACGHVRRGGELDHTRSVTHAVEGLQSIVRVRLELGHQAWRHGGKLVRLHLLVVVGVVLEARKARVQLRLDAGLQLELIFILILEGEVDFVLLRIGLALGLNLPQARQRHGEPAQQRLGARAPPERAAERRHVVDGDEPATERGGGWR